MYLRVLLLFVLICSVHLQSLDDKKVEKPAVPEKCTPNTVFKVDCNTCICGENGVAMCTLMECISVKATIVDTIKKLICSDNN